MLFNQKNPKMKSISDYEENIFHTNKNINKKTKYNIHSKLDVKKIIK